MLDPNLLQGPIPGMSLVTEPGNRPWENPAMLTTVSEAIDFYTEKLLDEDADDLILLSVDNMLSVEVIADFLTTSGTMNGIHSLDVAFLVNPVVRELIMYVADSANFEYVTSYSEREKKKKLPYRFLKPLIKEVFEQEEPRAIDTEITYETKDKGLMSRPQRIEE